MPQVWWGWGLKNESRVAPGPSQGALQTRAVIWPSGLAPHPLARVSVHLLKIGQDGLFNEGEENQDFLPFALPAFGEVIGDHIVSGLQGGQQDILPQPTYRKNAKGIFHVCLILIWGTLRWCSWPISGWVVKGYSWQLKGIIINARYWTEISHMQGKQLNHCIIFLALCFYFNKFNIILIL